MKSDDYEIFNMQFLYSALSWNDRGQKRFTYYYPWNTCTHKHLLNSSMEHTTRGYTLQGAMGDQGINSFLCILPGSHLRLSEPEHISGTNLTQGL